MSTKGPEPIKPISYDQMRQFIKQGDVEATKGEISKYIEHLKDGTGGIIRYQSRDDDQIFKITIRCGANSKLTDQLIQSIAKADSLANYFQLGKKTKKITFDLSGDKITREFLKNIKEPIEYRMNDLQSKLYILENKILSHENKILKKPELLPELRHLVKKQSQLTTLLNTFNRSAEVFKHKLPELSDLKATQKKTEEIWNQSQHVNPPLIPHQQYGPAIPPQQYVPTSPPPQYGPVTPPPQYVPTSPPPQDGQIISPKELEKPEKTEKPIRGLLRSIRKSISSNKLSRFSKTYNKYRYDDEFKYAVAKKLYVDHSEDKKISVIDKIFDVIKHDIPSLESREFWTDKICGWMLPDLNMSIQYTIEGTITVSSFDNMGYCIGKIDFATGEDLLLKEFIQKKFIQKLSGKPGWAKIDNKGQPKEILYTYSSNTLKDNPKMLKKFASQLTEGLFTADKNTFYLGGLSEDMIMLKRNKQQDITDVKLTLTDRLKVLNVQVSKQFPYEMISFHTSPPDIWMKIQEGQPLEGNFKWELFSLGVILYEAVTGENVTWKELSKYPTKENIDDIISLQNDFISSVDKSSDDHESVNKLIADLLKNRIYSPGTLRERLKKVDFNKIYKIEFKSHYSSAPTFAPSALKPLPTHYGRVPSQYQSVTPVVHHQNIPQQFTNPYQSIPKQYELSERAIKRIHIKQTLPSVEEGLPARKKGELGRGAAKVAVELRIDGVASRKISEEVLQKESQLSGQPLREHVMREELKNESLFESFDYRQGKYLLALYQNRLEQKMPNESSIHEIEEDLFNKVSDTEKRLLTESVREDIRRNKVLSKDRRNLEVLEQVNLKIKRQIGEIVQLRQYAENLKTQEYNPSDDLAKLLSKYIRSRVNKPRLVESYLISQTFKKITEYDTDPPKQYKNDIKMIKILGSHIAGHIGKKYVINTHVFKNLNDEETIIAEYCNQGSLQDYIKKMKPEERVHCALQLALGYCALSKKDQEDRAFIHRDCALKNVLVHREISQEGEYDIFYKINDFGLSELLKEDENAEPNTDGRYTPPESYADPSVYNEKTDVYSYGISLLDLYTQGEVVNTKYPGFEIMTLPFKIQDSGVMSVWGEEIETVRSVQPQIAVLITKCLDLDPEKRPTFVEIAKEIKDTFKEQLPDGLVSEVDQLVTA